jgi:hypothetical protein
LTNYRPSSLLTVFSKVLEEVMYNRLGHHMHTNNILVPEQFCIRQGNAAFKLTNSVLKSVNQKIHVGGIFCDLTKASDCVNHELLLAKLHYYGIQDTVINWFRSYLRNRNKKTEIKSYEIFSSKLGTVKHGVPQGQF